MKSQKKTNKQTNRQKTNKEKKKKKKKYHTVGANPKYNIKIIADVVVEIVGLKTDYAISAYHTERYEFESRSGKVNTIQYYVKTFVSDLLQVSVFFRVSCFLYPTHNADREDVTEKMLKVSLNTINQQDKIVECDNIDTPNTQIHDRKLSRLGKVKLIYNQSCRIKLVLWIQASSLTISHT